MNYEIDCLVISYAACHFDWSNNRAGFRDVTRWSWHYADCFCLWSFCKILIYYIPFLLPLSQASHHWQKFFNFCQKDFLLSLICFFRVWSVTFHSVRPITKQKLTWNFCENNMILGFLLPNVHKPWIMYVCTVNVTYQNPPYDIWSIYFDMYIVIFGLQIY